MNWSEVSRTVRRAVPAATVLLLVACGGSTAESPFGSAPGTPARDAVIVIDNENAAFSDLTIYLIPEAGVRRRLGSVKLNESKVFRVQQLDWGGAYRLLADPAGGRDFVSRAFVLARGDVIEWDLNLNRLRYQGRGGD